jgi:hypothetical protein
MHPRGVDIAADGDAAQLLRGPGLLPVRPQLVQRVLRGRRAPPAPARTCMHPSVLAPLPQPLHRLRRHACMASCMRWI